jgi:mannose-6-phosphate isomerase-like protein (cupin superfamily)
VEEAMRDKVNLEEKLSLFSEYWSPRIVGELNDSHIKLVKVKGEFTWHHHEKEDELFLVLKGALTIKLRERDILVEAGEFFVVPRGVEHKPVAEEETHILLLEPRSLTRNTGNVVNELTAEKQPWI